MDDHIKCIGNGGAILQINGQVEVSRGQILKTFPKWGPKYKVEFDITVDEVPTDDWTNVLHFTNDCR